MEPSKWLSGHHLRTRRSRLVLLIVIAALLQGAAGTGMAYVVGWSKFATAVRHPQLEWIAVLVGALAVSCTGYYYATRGVYEVDNGPSTNPKLMRAIVAAGFGGFLAHGASALDLYALHAEGVEDEQAKVRVGALAGLEHGVLGLLGTAAALIVLVDGLSAPPGDFTLPWAVIPIPGFLVAFYLARRHAGRYRQAQGWRRRLGRFLGAVALVRLLFTRDLIRHPAVAGMAVFWAAEMFALWAGMAAFGFHMNAAQLVVGAGTGMVFTRRTAPLGGAGILIVTLVPAIWYSGAPFSVAVLGVFAYRVLSLWLPMPFGLAALPTLRRMGQEQVPGAEERAAEPSEPALPDRKAG